MTLPSEEERGTSNVLLPKIAYNANYYVSVFASNTEKAVACPRSSSVPASPRPPRPSLASSCLLAHAASLCGGGSMQDDVPLVPVRRGKKPTAPEHIKVYKTAVFKIHNPSNHKRAMLADSMKRAHLAYTRLLAHLLPDVERFAGMTKKDRNAEMQTRIYRFVQASSARPGREGGHPHRRAGPAQQLHRAAQRPRGGADPHRKSPERGERWPMSAALAELAHARFRSSNARTSYETKSPDSPNRRACAPSATTATIAASTSSCGMRRPTGI